MPGPNQFQIRRTSVADREANTITLPNAGELALNILDGRAFSTNGAVVFEIGANTKNCRVSNSFFVGNSVVNVFANSTIIQVANSTVNTHIAVPTSGQYSATNYFLHANGSWVQVTGGSGSVRVYQSYTTTADQTTFTVSGGYTIGQIEVFENGVHLANTEYTQDGSTVVLGTGALVGAIIEVSGWINMGSFSPVASGSNTWVQFNDSTAIGGSAGFTFDKATNTAVVGNTLAVGTAWTANSTLVNANAINCRNQVNTATLFVSTTIDVGANVDLSTTQLFVGNSTTNTTLGNNYIDIGNTTVNVYANSTLLKVANSTSTANLSPSTLTIGSSTVNSTVISAGAGSLLSANIQINPQTGTTYTLASSDSGKVVTMNNAGSMTVTVPAGLPIGFRTQVLRLGAGTCTLSNTGQTGCSIFSRTAAFAITVQYGSASVFQTATANTYIIDGSL